MSANAGSAAAATTAGGPNLTERRGLLYSLISAVFLAGVLLIAKTLLRSMSPWVFTSYFFLIGSAAYVGYFILRRDWAALRPSLPILGGGLLVGLLDVGYTLGYFYGLSQLNPAVAAFIGHSGELLATLAGIVLLRETVTARELAAIAVAFAGLALVTARFDAQSVRGTVSILIAALFFASSTLLVRRLTRRFHPVHLSFCRTLLLGLIMLSLSYSWLGFRPAQSHEWPLLLLAGFIGPFLNYLFFFKALALAPVSRVSVIRISHSLFVLMGSVFIYHQVPALRQIGGGLLLIAGIALLLQARAQANRTAAAARPTS